MAGFVADNRTSEDKWRGDRGSVAAAEERGDRLDGMQGKGGAIGLWGMS
jgi:hypothetical protein